MSSIPLTIDEWAKSDSDTQTDTLFSFGTALINGIIGICLPIIHYLRFSVIFGSAKLNSSYYCIFTHI